MEAAVDVGSLPRWGFATPGRLRDELTSLALAGTKTGTAGLLVEFDLDGEAVPRPGDRSVLVDSAERPVALVETVALDVLPLADVSDEHAISEGEGYANAAEFREAHERYWRSYLAEIRTRLGNPSFDIADETPVTAERFRILEVLSDAGDGLVPRIRPAYPADRPMADAFLVDRDSAVVARLGELVDTQRQPALIAEGAKGRVAGVLTWRLDGASLEVLTLHAEEQWRGTGTTLLAAARRVAEASGATRLWLITTNDNVDALRFYQRRGFRFARLHAGAVDRSRETLKPSIPELGLHGIPLRDELELELVLGGQASL